MNLTRREFLKKSAVIAPVILFPELLFGCSPPEPPTPIKERVLNFTWDRIKNWENPNDDSELAKLTTELANSYLGFSETKKVSLDDLKSKDRLKFDKDRDSFTRSVRTLEPDFRPTLSQWGYTHYASKRVFVDLGSLREQTIQQTPKVGLVLIDALWHEWGHLDVTERTTGELINKPEASFIYSPVSRKNEPYKRYRGGAVYTDTYYGFLRFEEILNETVTVRRMIEQVGLAEVVSSRDYYQNGVDFFPALTSKLGISLETLYQAHATSDFEGLAKLIGEKLPNDNYPPNTPPVLKGKVLFVAIHDSNRPIIAQTGALKLIGQ